MAQGIPGAAMIVRVMRGGSHVDLPMSPPTEPWMLHPARNCAGVALSVFYPPPPLHRASYTEAKAICVGCPFTAECLAYAYRHDTGGVWGGTTCNERNPKKA
jgi:hypothetical protein